jgi:hypothetical protein
MPDASMMATSLRTPMAIWKAACRCTWPVVAPVYGKARSAAEAHQSVHLSASCVTADTMIAPAETSVVTKAMQRLFTSVGACIWWCRVAWSRLTHPTWVVFWVAIRPPINVWFKVESRPSD